MTDIPNPHIIPMRLVGNDNTPLPIGTYGMPITLTDTSGNDITMTGTALGVPVRMGDGTTDVAVDTRGAIPVNTFDEWLIINGYVDDHQDSHVVGAAGSKYYYGITIPNDATYQYMARISANVNTFTSVQVNSGATFSGGTVGTINNCLDGGTIRTARTIITEGVTCSASLEGTTINWHSQFGASGDGPQVGTLGGNIALGGWRGLANNTPYLLIVESLDADCNANVNIEMTKI